MFGFGLGVTRYSGQRGEEPFSFGNALKFDGVNDVVLMDNAIPINSNFSLSFWILRNTTANEIPFARSNATNYFIYFLNNNVFILSTALKVQAPSALNLHHIVVTRNNDVLKYYQNSDELYSGGVAIGITQLINIGGYGSLCFNGKIDEVAVWDKALTASEVSNLYNGGNGDFATNYQLANLISYKRFNSVNGLTVIDEINTTYNGTLNNFDVSQCPFDGSNTCPWQPIN